MIGGHLFKGAERCSYKLHMMPVFLHFLRVSCVKAELVRRQDCVITEDAEILRPATHGDTCEKRHLGGVIHKP